jgi:hypothetical protein
MFLEQLTLSIGLLVKVILLIALAGLLISLAELAIASRRPKGFPPGPPTVPLLGKLLVEI